MAQGYAFLSVFSILFVLFFKSQMPLVTAQSCEAIGGACYQNASCNVTLQAYLSACSAVLVSGNASDCTQDCLVKLNASNAREPAFQNCTCSTPMCKLEQNNIIKGCFGVLPTPYAANQTPAPPLCTALGNLCAVDLKCGPALVKYLSDCDGIINNRPNSCTLQCVTSLLALYKANPAFDGCGCASGDTVCENTRKNILDCAANPPTSKPPENCLTVSQNGCGNDQTCTTIVKNYLDSCDAVFTSGASKDCTTACKTNLEKAVAALPAFADCTCGGDSVCHTSQVNIQKACYGLTLPPSRTCDAVSVDCQKNPACAAALVPYLNSCDAVLKSGNSSDCSQSCLDNLQAVIKIEPEYEYCTCAQNDTICMTYGRNIQQGCFPQIGKTDAPNVTPTPNLTPTATAKAEKAAAFALMSFFMLILSAFV